MEVLKTKRGVIIIIGFVLTVICLTIGIILLFNQDNPVEEVKEQNNNTKDEIKLEDDKETDIDDNNSQKSETEDNDNNLKVDEQQTQEDNKTNDNNSNTNTSTNNNSNNSNNTQKTTTKNINVDEPIVYSTQEVQEVNLPRGQKQTSQVGKNGVKRITYKVTYNSNGTEISRTKVSESVISQPVNQIVKVGVSDYNLNTDTIGYSGSGVYCLDEDLIDFGDDYPVCLGTTQGYFKMIYLKTGNYLYSYSVGETSYDDAVYQNIKPLVKLTNVYMGSYKGNLNGTTYNFQFLVGSSVGPQLNLLTEAECTKYGLACGRW